MADEKVLELSVKSFAADKLEIKVKNISGKILTKPFSIEFYAPKFLVSSKVNDAAIAAAISEKPVGAASLAGTVTGPASWSVWARRETSDTSVVIALFNDADQTGDELPTPIEVAAGAEFIIQIPLNPQADRTSLNLVYGYQHGADRIDDKLELKSDKIPEWTPDVTLTTNHESPMAIEGGSLVKIFWRVKDGVSGRLRGPLPGGNAELILESRPEADFKISAGALDVLVVSAATYILQAQVKGPNGKDNVEVVRMLSLDTTNENFMHVLPRPIRVLPYGLIEIDWAAWGPKQVMISLGGHTNRTYSLTRQTMGRFYEGSGVMRVIASKVTGKKALVEQITLSATGLNAETATLTVIPWISLTTAPKIEGVPMGLAVVAPRIALLTTHGLHIAHVGNTDPSPEKLDFTLKPIPGQLMWLALAAVDQRFVCLRQVFGGAMPEVEIVPFTSDGNADKIPPVTLPPEVRPLAFNFHAVFDFVGFRGRAYFVVEAPLSASGTVRRAWSVAFDGKKADLRPEPLLEPLIGYRLVSFDNGLYALNRNNGRMFRFDLSKTGTLEPPKKAASAVKKGEGSGAKEESLVKDGVLVPVGRLLVVLNPTSVPEVSSLERYGLQNTLRHSTTTPAPTANNPQDLVYNPQKDYWARCGHHLDAKPDAFAAFRGESMRLWVVQPDNQMATLAVGDETLFAPNYVFEFPSQPIPKYLNKTRQFKITNNAGLQLSPLGETLRNAGLTEFSAGGPTELSSELPEDFRSGTTETFEFNYNDADPVPVTLRFQVQTGSGIRHIYLLEMTFAGPDLATATSVFKRVAIGAGNALSIVEIPDTAVQHATNKTIVIPPPKRLVEGVSLRGRNATTFTIWQESPEARNQFEFEHRYFEGPIKITYDTPAFYFLAYGAGELHVDVDFALPPGLETSPGKEPQRKLLRINTDQSTGLHAEPDPTTSQTAFECKLTYLRKQELNAVYIGDGVARERGEAIFLPVARSDIQGLTQIWKINPDNLSVTQSADLQSKNFLTYNVFAPPNSIAVSGDYVYAMFADKDVQVLDFSLQLQDKVSTDDYSVVTGMKGYWEDEYLLLGMKQDNANFRYKLVGRYIFKERSGPRKISVGKTREVSLDAVKGFREQNKTPGSPAWVSSKTISPMALSSSIVSPGGERVREVAVGIDGGLFVVGSSAQNIRTLALEAAHREEDIVFGREGKHIYCLHSESDNVGLRLSRVDNVTWKQTHSLQLQTGEKAPDLTTDTRQQRPAGLYKAQRSISIVRTLDDKLIFVSHGRTIFKIDAATMKVLDSFKMELPCRVFHVWAGRPSLDSHPMYGFPTSCILLYAIGATYKGDGFKANEFKTQLYKIGIRD